MVEILSILAAMHPAIFDSVAWVSISAKELGDASVGVCPSFIAGLVVTAAGTLIRVVAYRQLSRNFTFQLAVRNEHKLSTSGIYSVVRHPSYTGALMFLCGMGICQLGSGSYFVESGMWKGTAGQVCAAVYLSFIAFSFSMAGVRTRQEDETLRTEFKEQWDAWARETRYRLIPFVY